MKLSNFLLKLVLPGSLLGLDIPNPTHISEEWPEVLQWFEDNIGEISSSVSLPELIILEIYL